MSISCTSCGAEMPDHSGFCPACGRSVVAAVAPAHAPIAVAGEGSEKLAGAFAYVTFIPAIVFLFTERFKRSRYVRFHSFQCLFLSAALVVIAVALSLLFSLLAVIPFIGHLLALLAWPVLSIGCFILWVLVVLKAYQGEMFKLPLIGNWAERQADS